MVVRINGEKVTDLQQEKCDPLQREVCHLRDRVCELEEIIAKNGLKLPETENPQKAEKENENENI